MKVVFNYIASNNVKLGIPEKHKGRTDAKHLELQDIVEAKQEQVPLLIYASTR